MLRKLVKTDGFSRRAFLELAAKAAFGLSIIPATRLFGAEKGAAAAAKSGGRAKRVIYLFMNGAMSHLDTFDVKPAGEASGESKPIDTNVPGVRYSSLFPQLAKQADKIAVVRSLYTETGAHEQGRYIMRTSYKPIATTRHPTLGAWAQKILGKQNPSLSDYVVIDGEAQHPGAGFLDPSYNPIPIGDPNAGLQNTKAPDYVSDELFGSRMRLIDRFDRTFQRRFPLRKVEAYNDFYDQATRLLASSDLKAFDLNRAPAEIRDKYGRNPFGQGCLLARRLVENDVRFVEVSSNGWDHHRDIYEVLPGKAGVLDVALSALLSDLKDKGLLGETLVVLATEFGRTPKINENAGRDHHPGVFSCLLAGGGIKGGIVHGSSDANGHSPEDDAVSVSDFNATIARAMGLPLDEDQYSPAGRPFKVAHDGEAIAALFA
jgi:hypothetical protein